MKHRALYLASWLALCFVPCGCNQVPAEAPIIRDTKDAQKCATLQVSQQVLSNLLQQEDTDGDQKITVLDRGPRRFAAPTTCAGTHTIEGQYPLANLVQELFLAQQEGRSRIPIEHVEEPPVNRLHRLIRDRYWEQLTRRIDASSLQQVLHDPKSTSPLDLGGARHLPSDCQGSLPTQGSRWLYVPYDDQVAWDYYSNVSTQHEGLIVCRLPSSVTPRWVRSLSSGKVDRHGLLSLALRRSSNGELEAVPYVVPGGRFNELYGWDSYFHVLGLLEDGHHQLARDVVENQLYEVRHYGKVLNANRTYYLTRSQPPLLSSAVRTIWERSLQKDQLSEAQWLEGALQILTKEYEDVWNAAPRATKLCEQAGQERVCLATYHGEGVGQPPEVEPGHFDWMYQERADARALPLEAYRSAYFKRELPEEELRWLDNFFLHDRAMRESGHDTSYRFLTDQGDRTADFVTVDLNSLLFKIELDLATMSQAIGSDSVRWCQRAIARRRLIQRYLFADGLFVDYILDSADGDTMPQGGRSSERLSATTLYPLFASAKSPCSLDGAPLSLLEDARQARRLVRRALDELEVAGGLAATSPSSVPRRADKHPRQWDYPNGWAPHQILAWKGLNQHGFDRTAARLIYKWLFTIVKNAHDFHGTVPEKFDVVDRSHAVFAEYGNVGTEFSYITKEGFGWMNASFQLGRSQLSAERLKDLNRLIPPERIDWKDDEGLDTAINARHEPPMPRK